MAQINCSNPTIIVNPLAKDLIAKYKNCTIKGKMHRFSGVFLRYSELPWCVISPVRKKRVHSLDENGKYICRTESIVQISDSDLPNCYITDFKTGEIFPVYIQVPCGKCDICKDAKINSFVERCKMETQSHKSMPWFVTLTYDDEHLPLTGVSVREMQLFLKRFRINLERSGFNFKLRYVCVGEYGKTTHRAHYHLIIWGLDCFSSQDYEKVGSILYDSWDKGYTMHRIIDMKKDMCFYYTAKYMRKEIVVPTFIAPDGSEQPCNPFFCSNLEDTADWVVTL